MPPAEVRNITLVPRVTPHAASNTDWFAARATMTYWFGPTVVLAGKV